MTKIEFNDRCKDLVMGRDLDPVTAANYEIIEMVYMYHPSISNKEDIAAIYTNYGMAVIKDMLPRSNKSKDLEDQILKAKSDLQTLIELKEELSK